MEQFIIDWGYWAVAVGCFLEGETVLLLGGMLAHKGYLKWEWVVLAACIGGVSGDQLWFMMGRYAGVRWVSRMQRLQKLSGRLTRWTTRYGTWFVFGFRFLYGIRSVAPVFLGLSHYPIKKFVLFNILGAVVWSVVVAGLGWFLGATVQRLLGRALHIEEALLAVVAVMAGLWLWQRARRAALTRNAQ